ncbi:MAG: anti-sigma factor, partial [Solirubrobacteraceae bacterium]
RRARRRRTVVRASLAAAAAVSVAAVAAVALVPWDDDEPEPARRVPPGETVAFRDLPPGISMRATVAPREWGTAITVAVRGARAGIPCVVWLKRADGSRVSAGSFR